VTRDQRQIKVDVVSVGEGLVSHAGSALLARDHDGHRFQAILTDQPGEIAHVKREHRGRARVEDHIRNKDTGMRNLPFRDFEHNRIIIRVSRVRTPPPASSYLQRKSLICVRLGYWRIIAWAVWESWRGP
jgi:hypothetical protein